MRADSLAAEGGIVRGPVRNEIVHVVSALLVPFVLVFGIYVVAHGHYTPGGGFTGGVLFGVAIVLLRFYADREVANRHFRPNWAVGTALSGLLLFIVIGLVPMFTGSAFLDYAGFAPFIDLPAAEIRYLAILVVEVAVGLGVAGTMILLFDTLAEGEA
jgi:multicomponent Na+:H+ antiporter subunit B